MSDTVLTAAIGTLGTVVGAVAAIVVARIQAAKVAKAEAEEDKPLSSTKPPGGEVQIRHALDIRELRILRALFGEPKGRYLEAYKDSYYRPALDATVKKGLVAIAGKRYHLTDKGADFSRAYVKELLDAWRPPASPNA